ncbi:MAG TPA: hypothetical protein VFF39_11455 [Verrucomicrobiae bacterium]|nr:hypothetical protein [Verrucomicrobiae bacterium]
MKQFRTLALLAICVFSFAAFAQQTPPADPHDSHGKGQQAQGMHKMPSAEEMVQMMDQRIGFTADQKPKVTKIAEDMHQKMEAIQSDTSLSSDDRMAKMKTMHESAISEVRSLLNDEQKKKLDDWQKEMHDHSHAKGGDHAHQ